MVGPMTLSMGPTTTMELRFGARVPPPLGAKPPKTPPTASCVITGKPAKYRDPLTGQPYANAAAFKELRRRRRRLEEGQGGGDDDDDDDGDGDGGDEGEDEEGGAAFLFVPR